MSKPDWRIKEGASDWECDRASSERFHLRYFKALPIEDKLKAVEEMCRLSEYLAAHKPPAKEAKSDLRK